MPGGSWLGCPSTVLVGTRTVRLNEIRRAQSPICSSSVNLILAFNEFGLNLAKYLPNGVSIFILVSVEGPDVTLRLFGMLEAVVVTILVV